MPLFYTPKPRQFHYTPRFYDPEKEEWEALKKKYAMKQEAEARAKQTPETESEVDYFERRLKELDRKEKKSGLGINDLFRKREMPKFNYQPRFANSDTTPEQEKQSAEIAQRIRSRKMSRRFDIEDTEYFKPISAGKIMLYVMVVVMMLIWIFF